VDVIRALGAEPAGVVIALDRQERGRTELSAVQEVQTQFGMPVAAIVRLRELVAYLADRPDAAGHLLAIEAYRGRYGIDA
jgi:orotate phosphoribosyltransferase